MNSPSFDERLERLVFEDGYFDPYDLWATRAGVASRERFYAGRSIGKLGATAIALADWSMPSLARRVSGCPRRSHPITVAQAILALAASDPSRLVRRAAPALDTLERLASKRGDDGGGEWSWGLGFPWMSKNGLYGPEVPFVTHTPYVMEALLALAALEDLPDAVRDRSRDLFDGTWAFLERLETKEDTADALAVSYAPVDEPRIVVNANAYAAFAYALHARHGRDERREIAEERATRLQAWVLRQQGRDGQWTYYADDGAGNFIDCFHSCFVVKNLRKSADLLPRSEERISPAIERGWEFIGKRLFDHTSGLCRRFATRSHRDPYRWDLYDQAEYLGLLARFGSMREYDQFRRRVLSRFRPKGSWVSRIDVLGRRWGRDFLRWGVLPFLHAGSPDGRRARLHETGDGACPRAAAEKKA